MKRILFLSKSRLSHNLIRAVLPLISGKTELVCVDSPEEFATLPKRGKAFSLVAADWNIFADPKESGPFFEAVKAHPLVQKTGFILFHAPEADFDRGEFSKKGFKSFHQKPFLPEELCEILSRAMK